MIFKVEVIQFGPAMPYGKANYEVNANTEEEAFSKALRKASKDWVVASTMKIVSHSH